jgi:hypothetical protein
VPSKWHWVYVATVFRLDHRGQTSFPRQQLMSTAALLPLFRKNLSCARIAGPVWRRLDELADNGDAVAAYGLELASAQCAKHVLDRNQR